MVSDNNINNDELAAFVTSTLIAIANGVEGASTENFKFVVPHTVNFEVAVKATKSAEAGGGLRIQVFSAEGKKASHDEEVSRITFEVRSSEKRSAKPVPRKIPDWMA